jgi:hypothetical protein
VVHRPPAARPGTGLLLSGARWWKVQCAVALGFDRASCAVTYLTTIRRRISESVRSGCPPSETTAKRTSDSLFGCDALDFLGDPQ